jgi:hypothetical protein
MAPTEDSWEDSEHATDEIAASLSAMADRDVQRLNETQLNLIDVMTRRIEYAESRRSAFATVAGGFIAAGIALISISLGDHFWFLDEVGIDFSTGYLLFTVGIVALGFGLWKAIGAWVERRMGGQAKLPVDQFLRPLMATRTGRAGSYAGDV